MKLVGVIIGHGVWGIKEWRISGPASELTPIIEIVLKRFSWISSWNALITAVCIEI
jgi:hypothetical protein